LFILNTTCSSICLLHHDVDVPCSLLNIVAPTPPILD
jgi:hypothetical protein